MTLALDRSTTERPPVHPFQSYYTGGLPRLVTEAYSDSHVEGGSDHVGVTLETALRMGMPWSISDKPTIEITMEAQGRPTSGSDRGPQSTPFEIWPNDLPQLIACFIHAAWLGVEFGGMAKIDDEGAAMIRALHAVLPVHENCADDPEPMGA